MKRIVLWGSGECGEATYDLCNKYGNGVYDIAGWCDKNPGKQNQKKYGLPVYSPDDIKKMYDMKQIDMIVITVYESLVREVYADIRSHGIFDAYIVPQYFYRQSDNALYDIDTISFCHLDLHKPFLEYYEFHICDHCNLNCRGCGHVSNICKPEFADLELYVKDLKRIKELFSGCRQVKLLGGEPLLNPQLKEFIAVTREYFPECDLRIGTNGLLIPRAEKELFEVMRDKKAYFFVSLYPPVRKMRRQIESCCMEQGVDIDFTCEITRFNTRLYCEKRFDRERSYKLCKMQDGYCFTLRNGKISPCATFYFRMLNDLLEADFDITQADEFDLYKEQDGWHLDKVLHEPIPFCEYCGSPREFEWESGAVRDVCLSDYVNEG